MFLIKSLDSLLPAPTSQTGGCASSPSGVHLSSCPYNLVNTFQMSLMEIMCGFVPLRLQAITALLSKEDPLGQSYTALTAATTAKPALRVGGDTVRYATKLDERKSRRLLNHSSLFGPLLQRELLYCGGFKLLADTAWLRSKSPRLNKPIKVL